MTLFSFGGEQQAERAGYRRRCWGGYSGALIFLAAGPEYAMEAFSSRLCNTLFRLLRPAAGGGA